MCIIIVIIAIINIIDFIIIMNNDKSYIIGIIIIVF